METLVSNNPLIETVKYYKIGEQTFQKMHENGSVHDYFI